jgi:hypothetical protein
MDFEIEQGAHITVDCSAETFDGLWRMLVRQDDVIVSRATVRIDCGMKMEAMLGTDGRWRLLSAAGLWST